jgi:hypothetical protein
MIVKFFIPFIYAIFLFYFFQDIEDRLVKWFTDRRAAGVRVTGKALRFEALQLHKQFGSQSFKASKGWFNRFKKDTIFPSGDLLMSRSMLETLRTIELTNFFDS